MAQASINPGDKSAAFKLQKPFEGYNLSTGPSETIRTSRDELLKLFQEMWRVRRMEMAADALYKSKMIRGFCHLGIGQVKKAKSINSIITQSINQSLNNHSINPFLYFRRLYRWEWRPL